MLSCNTTLSDIPSIKKQTLAKLARLEIFTVRDLLYHFPHRYEDYSEVRPIETLVPDEKCTILGTIISIKAGRTFHKRMFLTEILVEDATGKIRALWFNQRFIAQMFKEGMLIRLSGKITRDREGFLMQNPAAERSSRDTTHTGRLVPIYPETAGITSKFFRWQITELFQKISDFDDPVPKEILEKLHLPSLKQALYYIHFPKDENHSLLAQKRFAFDEMLLMQLKTLEVKALFETAKATSLPFDDASLKHFIHSLPFSLTAAQEKAVHEILSDLSASHPMNRLLNGDVGSGKTVIAAVAAFVTAEHGAQTVILAPTEVLARQHFESFSKLFLNTHHSIALLTGSYRILGDDTVTRATLLQAIGAGIPNIIIGTHALLEDDVAFHDLALIIVDEQHRFGVAQRAKLQEMSYTIEDTTPAAVPHFLTMTATPIPRTFTLALFGNLDVSILDEMPKNRKPIITRLANTDTKREQVYEFMRSEITKGRQAFIILPLVEQSEAMKDVKAAVVERERLAKDIFPHLSIGLLHGKLKAKEKESVMRDFKDKRYDILVATAVVEVGIDVPNATIIMIEEAERFGLSQLHQFRGRVGRGEHQSYCFLLPGKNASKNERLRVLTKTTSGFDIAEADLTFRGPGAFFGTRQSGLPDIAMENLTNMKLIQIAQNEAVMLLRTDPDLTHHPLLKNALQTFEERIHFE